MHNLEKFWLDSYCIKSNLNLEVCAVNLKTNQSPDPRAGIIVFIDEINSTDHLAAGGCNLICKPNYISNNMSQIGPSISCDQRVLMGV